MDMTIQLVVLTVVAVGGAILSALSGWADSNELFNIRKFYPSIIRALIAGLLVVVGFQGATEITYFDYLFAFLGGLGVDAGGHRIAKVVSQQISNNTPAQ
jgi:O-antigen/teichoic acid export membrane protein